MFCVWHKKNLRCILKSGVRLNKMSDFIRYLIEEMTKKAIELTYAVMANFLKYVPGV